MATHYRVYGNGGLGFGVPVDLSIPIGETTDGSTALVLEGLADGDWLLVVRAYDDVLDLEDANLDAVRLSIRGGLDATGLPAAPTDASAVDLGGGSVLVLWSVDADPGRTPSSYRVWATAGPSVDDSGPPAAEVPHLAAAGPIQSATLALTPGTSYAIGVRAVNAAGASPLRAGGPIAPAAAGPGPVDSLLAAATA